jgi:hypothetical protein
MKQLKNYKIETLGLNDAILHKAVELGYKDETNHGFLLQAKYLFLHQEGDISWVETESFFTEEASPLIHPHDFLRLNWTPEVGEEVEVVGGGYLTIHIGSKCTVREIQGDGYYLENGNNILFFTKDEFIPIYPKKPEQKQEKPDACLIGFCGNVAVIKTCGSEIDVPYQRLHEYNLISEAEYVKRYPDKLTFKGWEVKRSMNPPDGYLYSCGCIENINEKDLISLLMLKEKIGGNADLDEVANWVLKHKKELGL